MRKFYHFRQNNSFGIWKGEKSLFVEGVSAEQANQLASAWGVYFDGVALGIDCSCCGDRWYPMGEYDTPLTLEEVKEEVELYAMKPEEYALICWK